MAVLQVSDFWSSTSVLHPVAVGSEYTWSFQGMLADRQCSLFRTVSHRSVRNMDVSKAFQAMERCSD